MVQKIKLTLEVVPDTEAYLVKQVTNSINWTPGQYLKKAEVKSIMDRWRNIDVIVNAPKNNG